MDVSNLSPLDRSLHELGMLSTLTESRHQYLEEMTRRRSSTMDSGTRRCAFHILQINSSFVKTISPCRTSGKRSSYRVKPYHTGHNQDMSRLPVPQPAVERCRTKSENSDNENMELKDNVCVDTKPSISLYKSKSLENINTSSPVKGEFGICLDEPPNTKTDNTNEMELVSSQIKYLNVSNK